MFYRDGRGYIWRHVDTVAATPALQRRGQVNAPAVWCWLRPVLDDGGCQDRVFLARGIGGEVCNARPLPCSAA